MKFQIYKHEKFKKKKKIHELLTGKYKNYKILELLTRIKVRLSHLRKFFPN